MIRVLHIDDEAPIRLLVRVNLEAEGLEVIEAADGRTAIPLAKREQPDVILLNVNLPGPDGWQVAEKLRENRETRETPIVFLTARAAFRDRAHGLDVGAVDYITKPFNPLELAPRLLGHISALQPPAPAVDVQQLRAVDHAAEDVRANASDGEFWRVDDETRGFLRDLAQNERRLIRERLGALILAVATDVFADGSEEATGGASSASSPSCTS